MIPKRFHFYYDAQIPFGIMHYAALKSCLLTQAPEAVTVWTAFPMSGVWWDKIKAEVTCCNALGSMDDPRAFLDARGGGIWATFTNVFLKPLDLSVPFQSTDHRGQLTPNIIASSSFLDLLKPRWLLTDPHVQAGDDWETLVHRLTIDIQPESEVLTFDTPVITADANYIFEYVSTYAKAITHLFDHPGFPELTVVYPVRMDGLERIETTLTQIADMRRRIGPGRIIVVEQGKRPSLPAFLADYPELQYFFVQETLDTPWAKGALVNTAMPWLRTKYLAVWDVDAFIPLKQITAAYKCLDTDAADVAMPFNTGHLVRRTALAMFRNGRVDFPHISNKLTLNVFMLSGEAYMYCVLIRTSVFKHIRGFSDILRGWGWEDVEIKHRLLAVRAREVFLPGAAFHINHPRPSGSRAQPLDTSRSLYETGRVGNMSTAERLAYLGITETPGEATALLYPKDPPQTITVEPSTYPITIVSHALLADFE